MHSLLTLFLFILLCVHCSFTELLLIYIFADVQQPGVLNSLIKATRKPNMCHYLKITLLLSFCFVTKNCKRPNDTSEKYENQFSS